MIKKTPHSPATIGTLILASISLVICGPISEKAAIPSKTPTQTGSTARQLNSIEPYLPHGDDRGSSGGQSLSVSGRSQGEKSTARYFGGGQLYQSNYKYGNRHQYQPTKVFQPPKNPGGFRPAPAKVPVISWSRNSGYNRLEGYDTKQLYRVQSEPLKYAEVLELKKPILPVEKHGRGQSKKGKTIFTFRIVDRKWEPIPGTTFDAYVSESSKNYAPKSHNHKSKSYSHENKPNKSKLPDSTYKQSKTDAQPPGVTNSIADSGTATELEPKISGASGEPVVQLDNSHQRATANSVSSSPISTGTTNLDPEPPIANSQTKSGEIVTAAQTTPEVDSKLSDIPTASPTSVVATASPEPATLPAEPVAPLGSTSQRAAPSADPLAELIKSVSESPILPAAASPIVALGSQSVPVANSPTQPSGANGEIVTAGTPEISISTPLQPSPNAVQISAPNVADPIGSRSNQQEATNATMPIPNNLQTTSTSLAPSTGLESSEARESIPVPKPLVPLQAGDITEKLGVKNMETISGPPVESTTQPLAAPSVQTGTIQASGIAPASIDASISVPAPTEVDTSSPSFNSATVATTKPIPILEVNSNATPAAQNLTSSDPVHAQASATNVKSIDPDLSANPVNLESTQQQATVSSGNLSKVDSGIPISPIETTVPVVSLGSPTNQRAVQNSNPVFAIIGPASIGTNSGLALTPVAIIPKLLSGSTDETVTKAQVSPEQDPKVSELPSTPAITGAIKVQSPEMATPSSITVVPATVNTITETNGDAAGPRSTAESLPIPTSNTTNQTSINPDTKPPISEPNSESVSLVAKPSEAIETSSLPDSVMNSTPTSRQQLPPIAPPSSENTKSAEHVTLPVQPITGDSGAISIETSSPVSSLKTTTSNENTDANPAKLEFATNSTNADNSIPEPNNSVGSTQLATSPIESTEQVTIPLESPNAIPTEETSENPLSAESSDTSSRAAAESSDPSNTESVSERQAGSPSGTTNTGSVDQNTSQSELIPFSSDPVATNPTASGELLAETGDETLADSPPQPPAPIGTGASSEMATALEDASRSPELSDTASGSGSAIHETQQPGDNKLAEMSIQPTSVAAIVTTTPAKQETAGESSPPASISAGLNSATAKSSKIADNSGPNDGEQEVSPRADDTVSSQGIDGESFSPNNGPSVSEARSSKLDTST